VSVPMPIPPYGFVYEEDNRYLIARRIVDVIVSVTVLVLFAPVLLMAAAAIKLEDRGPVLFVQRRVGRFGRLFPMLKLRTMRISGCNDALKPLSGNDPRITNVGRYLRRLSIDEFPQLFNVLRGDMTLVGPRPEVPFQHIVAPPRSNGSRRPIYFARLVWRRYLDYSPDSFISSLSTGCSLGAR